METIYTYLFLDCRFSVITVPMLLQLKCISAFIISLFVVQYIKSVSR